MHQTDVADTASEARTITTCPICKCMIRKDRMARHKFKVHGVNPATASDFNSAEQQSKHNKKVNRAGGGARAKGLIAALGTKSASPRIKELPNREIDKRALGFYTSRTGSKYHSYGCKSLSTSCICITESMLTKKYKPCEICLSGINQDKPVIDTRPAESNSSDWRRLPGSFMSRQ